MERRILALRRRQGSKECVVGIGEHAEPSDSSGSKVVQGGGVKRSVRLHQNSGAKKFFLSLTADLGQNNLATVSFYLLVRKHVSFNDVLFYRLHGDALLAQPTDCPVDFCGLSF